MSLIDDFLPGSPLFSRLDQLRQKKAQLQLERKRRMYRPILDRYMPPSRGATTIENTGDAKLDEIYRMLNRTYRSPQQREFHQAFLGSCLRVIYGAAYDSEKHRIMKKYGFESRKQQVLICAPRRMGKTFATAQFCVVMAVLISGIELSIFSPGKRQSVALMGHIADFMTKLNEADRILRRNEEKMIVRAVDGKTSRINAYPSAVRTLKGVSGTVIILEEMAQIPPEVLYEVVVPLHQISVTSIIGISTITTESNFMTRYLKQLDKHGEPLFAVKQIWLACEACRAASKGHECTHNNHLLPQWSCSRKRKIINCIMESQQELLAREIGGVASSLHQRAFPQKFVDQFKALPYLQLPLRQAYDFVFHAIDPAAAGRHSDFAITSMVRTNGQYVLIGIEAFTAKTALENHNLVIAHVRSIRKKPRFSSTMSVFILESNLGLESAHIANMLEHNLTHFVIMNEKDDKTAHVGFRTTNAMKTLAVETLRERILDNALRVASEDSFTSETLGFRGAVNTLLDQMSGFCEVLRESDVSQPKKFYSGKKGPAGKDDVIMTLMLMVHWSSFFFTSPKYSHYH